MTNFIRRSLGLFKQPEVTCVLTYNFSDNILFDLDNSATLRLLQFFGWVFSSVPGVGEFLAKHRNSMTLGDLLYFIFGICLKEDRTLRNLNMIAYGAHGAKAAVKSKAELEKEPWVRGIFICPPDIEGFYLSFLKGIDNYITVCLNHKELATKLWMHIHTISLGPAKPYLYEPDEPFNQATKMLAEIGHLVIVAAGNEGGIISGNSLNPWSLAPWVVCVGATNADGTQLLPRSSRGIASNPEAGPTVVAPGTAETLVRAIGHGHAVAIENIKRAPASSSVNVFRRQGIFTYRKDANDKISVNWFDREGNQRVLPLDEVEQIVKQGGSVATCESGTSFAAEYVAVISNMIVQKLHDLNVDIPSKDRPKLVKRILQDMAQPLPNIEQWKQGRGLVTQEIAHRYLQQLDHEKCDRLHKASLSSW